MECGEITITDAVAADDYEPDYDGVRIEKLEVELSEIPQVLKDLGIIPDKRAEEEGKTYVYFDATEGEYIVNYINKRKKGCKKWSTSMNLKKPKVKKNDHKWSFRKLREYAKTPEDKEVWRKLYKGYEPTKIDFEYNDYTGWNCYLRLRKVRD